jgi:hypothetical protein
VVKEIVSILDINLHGSLPCHDCNFTHRAAVIFTD